tara:strand:- start:1331 stop:1963 length:633 start_codon:yes stop_codon:yes gene_type:complete
MSSRKSLLSEGTVRRFMKLATLDNLTETFVDTLDEEDELESELHATEDELGAEDHMADEEADELAVADDDAALDVDPDTVEALVSAIADAIGDVTGTEVTVSSDEGPDDLAPEEEVEDVEITDVELPEEEPALEETQGADDREDEHLGAEDGKEADKEQSEKDRRKEMRGERRAKGEAGDPVATEGRIPAKLVEELTRRVAARLVRDAKK